jgi:uncharacterized membrane protein
MGTKSFYPVILTLVFGLLIINFNLGYNFWMVCTRALIFHKGISFDKTFFGYQIFDLGTLTFVFDQLIKNSNLGYNFWMVSTKTDVLHEYYLW